MRAAVLNRRLKVSRLHGSACALLVFLQRRVIRRASEWLLLASDIFPGGFAPAGVSFPFLHAFLQAFCSAGFMVG